MEAMDETLRKLTIDAVEAAYGEADSVKVGAGASAAGC